jgi:hypothetical protein
MAFAPSGFGAFGGDLFVLSAGRFQNNVLENDSGELLLIDKQTLQQSAFLTGLHNPIDFVFGSGTIFGDPSNMYLYLLEQGDLDPTTGIPLGEGDIVAFNSEKQFKLLADDIIDPSSIEISADTGVLFFTAGDTIFDIEVPEPNTVIIFGLAMLTLVSLRGVWSRNIDLHIRAR